MLRAVPAKRNIAMLMRGASDRAAVDSRNPVDHITGVNHSLSSGRDASRTEEMNEFVVTQLVRARGSNHPDIFIIERDPRLLRRPPRVRSELVSKFPVLKQLCRQLRQLVPSHVPPLPADRRNPSAWQGIVSSNRKQAGLAGTEERPRSRPYC